MHAHHVIYYRVYSDLVHVPVRPRAISPQGWAQIEEVARTRAKLPTDRELATTHGVSRRRIQQIMKAAREVLLLNPVVPREAIHVHTQGSISAEGEY